MPDTVILKDCDPKFKYEVAEEPGGEHIKICFACGVCTAGCPVSSVDEEYSPREIIRMIVLGMRKEVLSSSLIWRCQLCYTCYATCPQDVRFATVIRALRSMAIKEGYVHPSFLKRMEELDEKAQKMRLEMLAKIVDERDKEFKG